MTKQNTNWVSVEEKPPRKDKAFLACLHVGEMDIVYFDIERDCFVDYYYKQDISSHILFWMDLPEAPF